MRLYMNYYIRKRTFVNLFFKSLYVMKLTQTILAIGALAIVSVASAATGTVATPTSVAVGTGSDVSLTLSGAPRLVAKTSSSITLEWDKLATAGSYIVKYGKQSVATTADAYAEESEQVTGTGFTITGLTPATQYYLAVVVVDKDGMESDEFSDELAVLTDAAVASGAVAPAATTGTGAAAADQFRVTGANALNTLSFVVTFSQDVGTDPISVKVTRKSDQADIAVTSAVKDTANAKSVLVTLASPLDGATGYTVAVQSVKDTTGASIANGVNAMTDLSTPDALNAAPEATGAMAATATGTTDLTATPALPGTGAREDIVILAALLISGAAMYAYRRRMV